MFNLSHRAVGFLSKDSAPCKYYIYIKFLLIYNQLKGSQSVFTAYPIKKRRWFDLFVVILEVSYQGSRKKKLFSYSGPAIGTFFLTLKKVLIP